VKITRNSKYQWSSMINIITCSSKLACNNYKVAVPQ